MKSGARNACLKYNRIISRVPWARQNETVITIMNSVAPTALWLVVVFFFGRGSALRASPSAYCLSLLWSCF